MSCGVLKKLLLVVLVAGASQLGRAQFVVDGSESALLRWNQIKTQDYRFVYPAPFDSLGRAYALEWEKWKLPVSYSIGRAPNGAYGRRMPVILHPYLGYSNGMVVWTPRRMEMYTGPEMVNPWPVPWTTMLAIHEQRHLAQMQFLRERPIDWTNYVFGEALAGFWSIWYFDPSHFEGDAVTIETALTPSGRARTADFLEYFRASFGEGEFRNYERWRYGSQRLYTPDYYKVGYLAIGGVRAVYDKPLFMKDYNDWKISYRRQIRRQTGLPLKKAFRRVMDVQDSLWRVDDSLRAPFQTMEQITSPERYYVSFDGLAASDGKIYALRSGIARNLQIVEIEPDGGQVRTLGYTGADSPLSAGDGKLFWAEMVPDLRWEMKSESFVRYLSQGEIKTLRSGGRFFNPKASGECIAVCRTGYDGSNYVALLSSSDGTTLEEFRAPDGLTPHEAVVKGGEILCAAISEDGCGIYRLPSFTPVLAPSFVKINHLFVSGDKLYFTSDRTGVNELYALDGSAVVQQTCLQAGGQDFVFGDDGFLYFTYLRPGGRMICRTPVDSLPTKTVDFYVQHRYELEDRLSAQEAEIARIYGRPEEEESVVSEPRRYSKLAHAIKVHSWAPLFIDYDELANVSGESLHIPVGLGATAFFQNDLNTLYGYAAYGFNPGFMQDDGMPLHTGLVNIKYRGLYPIFEGKFGINRLDRLATLKTYVPLNLSSDGWTRAIIPVVSVGHSLLEGTVASAELRAYSMLPALRSCCFPRLGFGLNAGLAKDMASPSLLPFASAYAYLPGLTRTQGLGLSVSLASQAFENETVKKKHGVCLLGYEAKINYAIPFLSIDWNGLSPVAYIRNFEFIPKASYAGYQLKWDPSTTPLSVPDNYKYELRGGAILQAVLGNIWFIPYTFRIGVSAEYVKSTAIVYSKPYEIKFVFNTDLL